MASIEERNDLFSQTQDHWSQGFIKESNLIKNYQFMMDNRLSKPKVLKKIMYDRGAETGHSVERIYKNSNLEE